MPLAAAIPTLAGGLLPLFDEQNPVTETVEAARVWADAYLAYTLNAANVTVIPVRKQILAVSLTAAFNPELGVTPPGLGRSLFVQALALFWLGTPAIAPPGIVSIFIPVGSLDSSASNTSTPQEQANALADLIHQLTIKSAKIVPTVPGPPVPVA